MADDPQADHGALDFLSRRRFLVAAAIAGASGAVWLASSRRERRVLPRFQILRQRDAALFATLLPVIIIQADGDRSRNVFLQSLDTILAQASPATLKSVRQLVDALSGVATRYVLAGTTRDWADMPAQRIDAILTGWRNSGKAIPSEIYFAVTRLTMLAWYIVPEHQGVSGYPGPPVKVIE